MRKILISLSLATNALAFCEEPVLKPLWEEDQHFCYYRTLAIEGSVTKLDSLIRTAMDKPEDAYQYLDAMLLEVSNCKNSLGLPNNNN